MKCLRMTMIKMSRRPSLGIVQTLLDVQAPPPPSPSPPAQFDVSRGK